MLKPCEGAADSEEESPAPYSDVGSTMAQLQLTLSDLQARQVLIQWHEAVAIVIEVAEWVERGVTREYVPGLDDVSLTDEGRLLLRGSGPRCARPVQALAELLKRLIADAAAPPELRLLADQDQASANVHASVDEFRRALEFFARPNRAADLMVLAQRGVLALEREHAEEEFRRLKTRAAVDEPERPTPPTRRRAPSRRILVASAVIVLVAAASAGAWVFRAEVSNLMRGTRAWAEAYFGSGAGPTDPPQAPSTTGAVPKPGAGTVPRRSPSRPQPSRPGLGAPESGAGDAVALGPAAGPDATPLGLPTTQPGAGSEQPNAEARGDTSEGDAQAALASAPADAAPVVYREGDPGVSPPRFLRPQFPSGLADEAAPRVVTVEIVIDEAGNVESVRWLQAAGAYHERMMTSAMKAWRFAPATLDGKPVRFAKRLRVPQP